MNASAPSAATTHRALGLACAFGSAATFSAKAIFVKLAYANSTVDAVTLLTLRMAYAAPFYVALLLWSSRGRARLDRAAAARVCGLGLLGYYLASLLDFLGLVYISAALERLVLFLYPTIVVLLSAALARRRITATELGALALSYAGIAAVMSHDLRWSGDAGGSTWLGVALVFASAVAYAIYLLGAAPLIATLGSIRFTAAAMLVSASAAALQFVATRPSSALAQPAVVHGLALAMAVISTVVPTLLLGAAIKRIGSGHTALVASIGPIATIALGWAVLGEPISALELCGAALVLAGVILVSRPQPSA
ncbi:MAG: DMT family transporter [Nannocystaceae bacterium]|nr:DMT family transporter [Nannocystaceae bacterium]